MTITAIGKIEKKGFGFGVWALVSEDGKTYELQDHPPELCQTQTKVKIKDTIQEGVMTLAMIGPVLVIASYEILS
jgi:hypothetical protein